MSTNHSRYLLDDEGTYIIDTATGEKIEIEDDQSVKDYAFNRWVQAKRSASFFESQRKDWQEFIVDQVGQDTHKYNGVEYKATQTPRRKLQVDRFLDVLGELTYSEQEELLQAATGFSKDRLSIGMREAYKQAEVTTYTTPFITEVDNAHLARQTRTNRQVPEGTVENSPTGE